MSIVIPGRSQSFGTTQPVHRRGRGRYPSAEAMLDRYRQLHAMLSSASRNWPDPDRVSDSPQHMNGSARDRAQVEVADILVCLKAVRFSAAERRLVRLMYRARGRHCHDCRHTYPELGEGTYCPKCGAWRMPTWSWESFPTVDVLTSELNAQRRVEERWNYQRVYRLRNRAYERLESSMRRRGLLAEVLITARVA